MKAERILLGMACASVFFFTTSLYGQQEVNPDWYNPWPDAASQAKPAPSTVSRAQAKPSPVLPQRTGTPLETSSLAGYVSKLQSHPVRKVSAIQVDSSLKGPILKSEDGLPPTTRRRRAEQVAELKSGS